MAEKGQAEKGKEKADSGAKGKGQKKGEEKRMVKISFSGKELLEGSVFDTTSEKEAKEAGILSEDKEYKPLTIILGENEMLPKVEKALEGMKEGDEESVKLSAKEGFGERNPKNIVVMPVKNFTDQKINPVPGLLIKGEINGRTQAGKIQSVSGGRVRVDFNHPLAGRELEYNVKLEEEVKGKKEKGDALYDKYFSQVPGAEKENKNGELYITLPSEAYQNLGQVKEAITRLGKDLGIKVGFKEKKGKKEGKTQAQK